MQTATSDTLVCDTARLARWWNDPDYDYMRGLADADGDWFTRLKVWLSHWLSEWFNWTMTDEDMDWFFIVLVVLCLLLVLWFVWRKHPGLFRRTGTVRPPAAEEEDTIYGISFEAEIRRAEQAGDYVKAVRYTYLYTLKCLHDGGCIDWQPYKTPTDYVYELSSPREAQTLRMLTHGFMRVRYGKFVPARAFYEEMRTCHEELCFRAEKGGGA